RRSSSASEPKPSLAATIGYFVNLYRGFPPAFRGPLGSFLWQVLRTCPEQFPRSLVSMLMGYHCYMYTAQDVLPKIDEGLARLNASGGESGTVQGWIVRRPPTTMVQIKDLREALPSTV